MYVEENMDCGQKEFEILGWRFKTSRWDGLMHVEQLTHKVIGRNSVVRVWNNVGVDLRRFFLWGDIVVLLGG